MIETFPNIIAFSVLGLLLVLGTVLRSKVAFLQYGLIPASLIGGIIGFTLFSTIEIPVIKQMNFAGFTFHFFTLSFISLCLTQGEKPHKNDPSIIQGSTWLSSIWIFSLLIQACIGLVVILIYNSLTRSDVSPFLGIIASHGFTQGPGQAMAIGSIWEQSFGIDSAVIVGLIYASIGFIISFGIGVPIARWSIRKGITTHKSAGLDIEFSRGLLDKTTHVSTGRHVTHPANVDTLAWHFSILGIVYLLTHIWLLFLQAHAGSSEFLGINMGLVTSHNLFFAHGLLIAIIVRHLLNHLGFGHMIDDETQKRITSTSVDFMMVAMLLSISASTLVSLLVPILLVTLIVTLVTTALCFGLGRQLANHQIERAITSFGTCTGSAGSALLLLRIVDPYFKTPVSKELAFFNVIVTLATIHIWGVFAPALPSLRMPLIVAVYLGTFMVVGLIFLQLKIRTGNKKT